MPFSLSFPCFHITFPFTFLFPFSLKAVLLDHVLPSCTLQVQALLALSSQLLPFLRLESTTRVFCSVFSSGWRFLPLVSFLRGWRCTTSLWLAVRGSRRANLASQISPNNQPGHRSSLTRQDGARDGRRERAIPFLSKGLFDVAQKE